jgi:site-specific DNA-methyltransferase (cytosine-N4-specific)
MEQINRTSDPVCRNFFKVVLSNIIRKVSWQKDDDLRVRREIRTDVNINVIAEFMTELNRSVKTTLALVYENQDFQVGQTKIAEGDTRYADLLLGDLTGKVDMIITSPPYATALPYLDTDRLSLYYLGLLSRSEHRQRDYDMIGNREVTNGHRQRYWEKYLQNRHKLTQSITSVIDLIYELNSNSDVGFRRRNLPSLLGCYFLDMRQVFDTFTKVLRSGAPAYVVVGNNHTTAGGQRVEIETDKLLAELGEAAGLRLAEVVPMEMLISRDIFKKNTSSTESILFFTNN